MRDWRPGVRTLAVACAAALAVPALALAAFPQGNLGRATTKRVRRRR